MIACCVDEGLSQEDWQRAGVGVMPSVDDVIREDELNLSCSAA